MAAAFVAGYRGVENGRAGSALASQAGGRPSCMPCSISLAPRATASRQCALSALSTNAMLGSASTASGARVAANRRAGDGIGVLLQMHHLLAHGSGPALLPLPPRETISAAIPPRPDPKWALKAVRTKHARAKIVDLGGADRRPQCMHPPDSQRLCPRGAPEWRCPTVAGSRPTPIEAGRHEGLLRLRPPGSVRHWDQRR
jgi:hypothetical protein